MTKMQELISAGLFGRGLIPVRAPLVERYNRCLADMGLRSTELQEFHIDRMGWSPEVASEFGTERYLSHGEANPLAIILTPDQARAPIYYPYHSFDWRMMDGWFLTHRMQVADLTKETAIWLDLDQDVSYYRTPHDLVGIDEMLLRANTPCGVMAEAVTQRKLVEAFLRSETSHMDLALMQSLLESRNRVGDLRSRNFILRDYQFSDVEDFYSRAFGGVFIFRSHTGEPLIFCRDGEIARSAKLPVLDQSTIGILHTHGYLGYDLGWWQEHLDVLAVIAESFLVDVLDECEPNLEFFSLNEAKRKKYIRQYASRLDTYFTLESLLRSLAHGDSNVSVPENLLPTLLHPAVGLRKASQEVVGQLITRLSEGRFVPYLYRHHKREFVHAYTSVWNMPKREWARVRIREYYEHASKSSNHYQ